jgi:Flp pilus assembly protein TadB
VVTAAFALLGATCGCAAILVIVGIGRRAEQTGQDTAAPRRPPRDAKLLLVALVAALVALFVTRWPVAAVLAAGAVLGWRGLANSAPKEKIAHLEAIATWTEMLRDTLAAAAGISQALSATAKVAPTTIRPAVQALSNRISTGVPAGDALVIFADDLSDQSADLVVAALMMAAEHRAQRVGDLLGALASTTREQVTMRLRIEASRASARTAVRTIAGFSIGFLALLAVFARSYLAPFASFDGQLVLAVVGGLFALGLWLMARMARPRAVGRLEMWRARS